MTDLWIAAAKHIPWFSSPLAIDELDKRLCSLDEWRAMRGQILDGDKIYPFAINVDTSAMKLGYVVLRRGKPIAGVITLVS